MHEGGERQGSQWRVEGEWRRTKENKQIKAANEGEQSYKYFYLGVFKSRFILVSWSGLNHSIILAITKKLLLIVIRIYLCNR